MNNFDSIHKLRQKQHNNIWALWATDRIKKLGQIYQLKANFQTKLKQINTLSRFAHDITGQNAGTSGDLPDVIDSLREMKKDFQSNFQGMQDSWIEIMGRWVVIYYSV